MGYFPILNLTLGIESNDTMANVITEYEQTTGNISWAKDYIYGGQGELVSLHLPRTAAMNAAFDNLMSFATAWLCYPSCTTQQLTWDTNSDDQINLYDYVDNAHNTDYFDGAFSSNIYYCLTDKNNSVVGIVDLDRNVEYITYNAWGVPSYTGDIQGLSVLWNGYYFDGETENYYLRNRYYSPTERKFLTEDPHGIIPDGNWNNPFAIMNQYDDGVGLAVYAGANPVMNRDDWGLKDCGSLVLYSKANRAEGLAWIGQIIGKGLGEYAYSIGRFNPSNLTNKMGRKCCKCFGSLIIMDHGRTDHYPDPKGSIPRQGFGWTPSNDRFLNEQDINSLCPFLCEGSTIKLMGCNVGQADRKNFQFIFNCPKVKKVTACIGFTYMRSGDCEGGWKTFK